MTTPPGTPPTGTLELGGRTVTIERPSGLKASRAIALMRHLSRAMPELQADLARFRRAYERENVVELDRVQARLRYPERPILDETGAVILDETGAPRMLPSPVDRVSDADWQASGGVYRMPASPSGEEVIAALFDRALEVAEEHVYALLALFTIPNGELREARRAGRADALITETAETLLEDAYADELLELAVVVGESVDHHFRRKVTDLGDRMGNALRLVGMNKPTSPPSPSPTPPSSSKPNSSTDSPASTPAGPPTSSSTPRTTSSSSSPLSPTETEPEPSWPSMTPA